MLYDCHPKIKCWNAVEYTLHLRFHLWMEPTRISTTPWSKCQAEFGSKAPILATVHRHPEDAQWFTECGGVATAWSRCFCALVGHNMSWHDVDSSIHFYSMCFLLPLSLYLFRRALLQTNYDLAAVFIKMWWFPGLTVKLRGWSGLVFKKTKIVLVPWAQLQTTMNIECYIHRHAVYTNMLHGAQ